MPVSTRRKAQAADLAAEEDPELTLRKKPVRKTATTTTKATTTKADPKSKTVGRPKKVEIRPDPESIEEDEEEKENVPSTAASAPAKTTRGAVSKSTGLKPKASTKGKAAEPLKSTAQTRTMRAGSVRGTKNVKPTDNSAPALDPPKPTKPTRQTRTTTTKAPPLSPKKVTQVSKVQTRNNNVAEKPKPTKGRAAAAPQPVSRARGTLRRRAVSDENADDYESAIRQQDQTDAEEEEDQDDEIMITKPSPVKATVRKTTRNEPEEIAESEVSMSSRPTTPSDSPTRAPSIASGKEVEEEDESDDQSAAESGDAFDEDHDESEDELNAPKTPMRRCSPGTEARYHASVRNTVRRINDNSRTPVHPQINTGTHPSTSKTVRPRAQLRPMQINDEKTEEAFDEEPSFIPDTDIIEVGSDIQHSGIVSPSMNRQLPSPPASVEGVDSEATTIIIDQDEHMDENPVQPAIDNLDKMLLEDPLEDPDETVVITQPDEDEHEDVDHEGSGSHHESESDETIVIDHSHAAEADDLSTETGDDSVLTELDDTSVPPEPETMVWESLRQDQTITVNFDEHLSNIRTLPPPEPTERLSLSGSFLDQHGQEASVESAEVAAPETQAVNIEMQDVDLVSDRRKTLDFGDFLNEAVLSEHAQPLADAADMEAEAEAEPSLEEVFPDEVVQEHSLMEAEELSPATPKPSDVEEEIRNYEKLNESNDNHDSSFEEEVVEEVDMPHYALSTIAFDARRKSLPAFSVQTPLRLGLRPNTSDGAASIQRLANPFSAWPVSPRRQSAMSRLPHESPSRTRFSTSQDLQSPSRFTSPHRRFRTSGAQTTPMGTPRERRAYFANAAGHAQTVAAPSRFRSPRHAEVNRRLTFHRMSQSSTPIKMPSPAAKKTSPAKQTETPVMATPVERRPRFAPRETYEEHVVAAKQPATPEIVRPAERRPRFAPRETYEEHAMTVAAPKRFSTPVKSQAKRRETVHRVVHAEPELKQVKKTEEEHAVEEMSQATSQEPEPIPQPAADAQPIATPRERYPRLRPRADYEEHARTEKAPVRFRTPSRSPLRRPATVQKAGGAGQTLLKTALKGHASRDSSSHTPIKTPLKAAASATPPAAGAVGAATPGQEPMTPHPAAPLRGVVALVEVFTLEGASASAPFVALLLRLGAKTTRSWNERITHVIFKDGSPTTLQRVRLHNKEVEDGKAENASESEIANGNGIYIHCVNSRWVTDCDTEGTRKDESDEAYVVDLYDVPRGGKRRRKSMEPAALLNVNGNVVRDRKSSLGRSSLSRGSMRFSDSPAKRMSDSPVAADASPAVAVSTPSIDGAVHGENMDENGSESPVTPAWIAAPDQLVQQTAPMNRIRKLQLQGSKEEKNRRLTFWHGASA